MPLLFLLPYAGSITIFLLAFLAGYLTVRYINNRQSQQNTLAPVILQKTEKYAPVPVKDKTTLTLHENKTWQEIVNNIDK